MPWFLVAWPIKWYIRKRLNITAHVPFLIGRSWEILHCRSLDYIFSKLQIFKTATNKSTNDVKAIVPSHSRLLYCMHKIKNINISVSTYIHGVCSSCNNYMTWYTFSLSSSIYNTVYCKSFKVEKFCGFRGSTSKCNSELVIMLLCNTQDYHATANVLQQITIHFFNRKTFPICNNKI